MEKQRSIGGVSAHYATELAVFFASQASEHITGRLISALHDNWQQMNALHPDIYKLRRIDTYTLKKLNPNWEIE